MKLILEPLRQTAGVRWSAAATVRRRDGTVEHDALDSDVELPTASIGKVLLLATVLGDIERGVLDPGEQLAVEPDDLVADSGLLQHLDRRCWSIIDLCRLVGSVSDNLATNLLIRRVGLARVSATAEQLGLERCRLHDSVRDVRRAHHPPYLSTGSAAELEELVRRLSEGSVVSAGVSRQLVAVLRLNTDLSMVAAAFGFDPLAHIDEDLGVRLFNKTGTQRGTRADVGHVEATGEGSASYAVIARFEDSAPTRRRVLRAMSDVGTALLRRIASS